jgi:small subunit ribosomal protein S6
MAKKYELVLILDPQIGDTQLETSVEKYKTQLESAGAEVVNVDTWGLRKLAYTSMALRQRKQAFYVMYQFEGAGDSLVTLEANLRLDEAVLRHLVIAVEGEFLRIPQLAPENIYIYNPPARPHDRRGPRRDRDDRRDGPPGNRSDGPVGSRSEAAEPATVAVAAAGDDASADKSDE